jgi:putative chitinase
MSIWLAQCGYESMSFNRQRESLSYSMLGLMKTWPSRFPTERSAVYYVQAPERLANLVYANRLGNGDAESQDGWKYRGGGIIQLTGRANYAEAGKALGVPLETQPVKIEIKSVSARVAGWFWKKRGCNELADASDFEGITGAINGPAMLGLEARRELAKTVYELLDHLGV